MEAGLTVDNATRVLAHHQQLEILRLALSRARREAVNIPAIDPRWVADMGPDRLRAATETIRKITPESFLRPIGSEGFRHLWVPGRGWVLDIGLEQSAMILDSLDTVAAAQPSRQPAPQAPAAPQQVQSPTAHEPTGVV